MADFTDAIREMVEYMKANPEYRARVEKAGREFAEILEQSDKDFEAIRRGTYKPDVTRAEPRSIEVAEKLLDKGE